MEAVDNILDLTCLSKEVLLILEVLKENDEVVKRQRLDVLRKEVDWQSFLECAIHHRVYPTLYLKLKDFSEQLGIPTFVMQSLEQFYKQNTFQMLQLAGEMDDIGKLFAEAGIDTLFLKGPLMAHDLFGDISLRTSKDLDILIPLSHLDKAKKILKNVGYEQTDTRESLFDDWQWKYKDISFYHPQKQIEVEVHWRLSYWPEKEPSFTELWARRTKSTLTQSPCYSLGKEDLFYFLVIHGARHAWFRLRWLMDIQQIVKQPLNWKVGYQLFQKCNHVIFGGQAILLASQLFEMNITDEMKPFLKKRNTNEMAKSALYIIDRIENLHDPTPSSEIRSYYIKYNLSTKTISQRVMIKLSKLHPTSDDAQIFPLPKLFHFLYFPLRPILWLIRKSKRLALSQDDMK